jgi:hypothetical protein
MNAVPTGVIASGKVYSVLMPDKARLEKKLNPSLIFSTFKK